jgi:hypothetical protein
MKRFELTFTDVVKTICLRPQMYLMHGSFGEGLAFLDGYANGRRLGSSGRSSSFFNPFREWLCARFGWKDGEDFWTRFRDSYGEDQIALTEFARLWSEYEAEDHSAE